MGTTGRRGARSGRAVVEALERGEEPAPHGAGLGLDGPDAWIEFDLTVRRVWSYHHPVPDGARLTSWRTPTRGCAASPS
ncbi:hypothetical protein [Streptomyces sp. RerS4]|uniref:hypothetical protein n=1 Tax=Streptomyces sp. RerS4 TaxID=2942449 RepID=UPI00201BF28C|nr:hypothetical protein [Streptomyces sp. RerS4]UQX00345.1 hypothetical protein M4D82_07195 [Streptomyces sp. RerS4]